MHFGIYNCQNMLLLAKYSSFCLFLPKLDLSLEKNNFQPGSVVPTALCNNEGIEISIDQNIACPGGCCTLKLIP